MTNLYDGMSERALLAMRKIMNEHKDRTIAKICYVVEPGSQADLDERRTLELTEDSIDEINNVLIQRIKF